MNLAQTISHYEHLLMDDSGWLSEGLSWTVVRPFRTALSLEDLAGRMTGGGWPDTTEAAEDIEPDTVYLDASAQAGMLLEPGGFTAVGLPHVLTWLSHEAQVWHLSWNLTGHQSLTYLVHGQVLAKLHRLDEQPVTLAPELQALRAIEGAPWPRRAATAMAIVEARTGAHLERRWFDQPRRVALLDQPISPEPLPLGLWHHEPDLHAQLSASPHQTRRTALLVMAETLIDTFDLATELTDLLHAVRQDQALTREHLTTMRAVHEGLGRQWAELPFATREHDDQQWRRWVAANAVRHGLRSVSDAAASYLSALTYAREALDGDWMTLRTRLYQLIDRPAR
ncbi:hypothetical protein AB0C18_05615 [Nonomuraea muscovyensis]|uniref:hypothetical protein n=1 Tax=Nonomuraea muscovyensis TaxID=1124761 RepID=UPI00340651EC|nr:hypothetical protein [Nonomuraea muscovyensis]